MIRFIIGLGNPDVKYQGTPHNLGKVLVVRIVKDRGLQWESEGRYQVAKWGTVLLVLLPRDTHMNTSGQDVRDFLRQHHCPPEQILICHDDFDLPLGTIRIREKGSPGTHNGLRSVTEHLGTENFPRLRLGIGPLPPGADPADFVLDPSVIKENEKTVNAMVEKASEAIAVLLSEGIDAAMNRFNPHKAES